MYIARVRRLFVLLAPGARLRRLVCCFVSFANQCSGVSLCHDYGMIRRSLYLDRSPGLSFVQKGRCFPSRHELLRGDPSSGGGSRPLPTKSTPTTSYPARRLASSSKLLKSSHPVTFLASHQWPTPHVYNLLQPARRSFHSRILRVTKELDWNSTNLCR